AKLLAFLVQVAPLETEGGAPFPRLGVRVRAARRGRSPAQTPRRAPPAFPRTAPASRAVRRSAGQHLPDRPTVDGRVGGGEQVLYEVLSVHVTGRAVDDGVRRGRAEPLPRSERKDT